MDDFSCTSSVVQDGSNDKPVTSPSDENEEKFGFRWQQPIPTYLIINFNLFRCGSTEDVQIVTPSEATNEFSQQNKDDLKSFLGSPIASHFVHLSIVTGMNGHLGAENIAMLSSPRHCFREVGHIQSKIGYIRMVQ